MIFQGFQKIEQIKYDKSILAAGQDNVQKIKNDVKIQVISTYLGVLDYKDQLQAAIAQKLIADQQLQNSIKEFRSGRKMQSDTSRAKSQVLKTELDIANISNELNKYLVSFAQLLNLAPDTKVEFEKPNPEEIKPELFFVDDVFKKAVQIMPEIRQEENLVDAKRNAVKIAKSYYFPTLSLSSVIASDYIHQFSISNSLFFIPEQPLFKQLHSN